MRVLRVFYRVVLLLHPPALRRTYGGEMRAAFLDTAARRRAEGGRLSLLAYLVAVLADAVRTGASERLRAMLIRHRGLWLDLRGATRSVRDRPVWAFVLAATVALPAAANTVSYALVDAALLEPLGYREPERLVMIWPSMANRGVTRGLVTGSELEAVRERATTVASAGGIWGRFGILGGVDGPEHVDMGWVAGPFFETLGVEPHLGRLPTLADDVPGAPPILLISHGLWVRRFGADAGVIGRTVTYDGETRTIVGVMPAEFRVQLPPDAQIAEGTDVWAPRQWPYSDVPQAWRYFALLGRLAPGATVEQSRAELAVIARDVRAEHPEYGDAQLSFLVEPLHEGLAAPVRAPLLGVLAAALLALIVACVNAASLLLVRASERLGELRVRRALGAGRLVALRQILLEALLLFGAGALVGLLLASLAVRAFRALRPADLVLAVEPTLGPGVAVLTTAVVLLAGLPIVLVPLLRLDSGGPPGERGGTADRSVTHLRGWLISGQFALCFSLVAGAGLLLRSFDELRSVDRGFDDEGVLTARVSLPSTRYPYATPEPISAFYDELLSRLEASPDVIAAGATLMTPLEQGLDAIEPVAWDRASGEAIEWGSVSAHTVVTTPGWFEAVGAEVVRGRAFDARDRLDAPLVALVDERFAGTAWPGEDPIGRRVRVNRFLRATTEPAWATVIGVVRTVKLTPLGAQDPMQVWLDHRQTPRRSMILSLRARPGRAEPALAALRDGVAALDPELAVFGVRSMSDVVAGSLATARFLLSVVAVFALLAAMLAVVGIQGLVACAVTAARRDLGVRMALGATAGSLGARLVARGLRQAAVGLVLGSLVAFMIAPALEALVYGVSPRDPATYLSAALLLLAGAAAALAGPLTSVMRLAPAEALRKG